MHTFVITSVGSATESMSIFQLYTTIDSVRSKMEVIDFRGKKKETCFIFFRFREKTNHRSQ